MLCRIAMWRAISHFQWWYVISRRWVLDLSLLHVWKWIIANFFFVLFTRRVTHPCVVLFTRRVTHPCVTAYFIMFFYSDFVVILKRTLLILVTGSRINNYRIFAMKIPASKGLRQRLRRHVDDPLTTIIEGFIEILKLSHQNF